MSRTHNDTWRFSTDNHFNQTIRCHKRRELDAMRCSNIFIFVTSWAIAAFAQPCDLSLIITSPQVIPVCYVWRLCANMKQPRLNPHDINLFFFKQRHTSRVIPGLHATMPNTHTLWLLSNTHTWYKPQAMLAMCTSCSTNAGTKYGSEAERAPCCFTPMRFSQKTEP